MLRKQRVVGLISQVTLLVGGADPEPELVIPV